jgi:biopolymer transport protein ExbD
MSTNRYRIRRVFSEDVGLQIAPMIDVTLLLLFFFMLSGKLTRTARLKPIRVPISSANANSENASERDVINVDAEGHFFAGDQLMSTGELASHLNARFQKHPQRRLEVRADGETSAVKIKELMQMAAAAGAVEVVYGVRKP